MVKQVTPEKVKILFTDGKTWCHVCRANGTMRTGEALGKMSDLMMEETLRLILDLMSLKEA